jgi:ABC-2 type transport system permease protein
MKPHPFARFTAVFRKSMREMRRDLLVVCLTVIFAPVFVLMYALLSSGGSTVFGVLVLNQDEGVVQANGESFFAGEEYIAAMKMLTYETGTPILSITLVESRAQAEQLLRDRKGAALVIVPPDFSQAVLSNGEKKAVITLSGDLTNPQYVVAATLATAPLEDVIAGMQGVPRPVAIVEEPLGGSGARSEFEMYMPGLFIFAIVMLVFQAAMAVSREVESGTLRRMQITRMTAFDYLGGTSLALLLVALLSVILTFLTALACGFHSQGPLWLALLICILTGLAVIATGLVVAALSRTTSQAFIIANFPLAFYMFFSSLIFPLPRGEFFTIFGHGFSLYDLLPPTHAVNALNKIFTLGAGVGDVLYELGGLVVLTILYFSLGVWLFKRRHMSGNM